jgi:type I restriction enzyme M protein
MEACVVICRTRKPKERKGRILFIDAVHDVARERAVSFLKDAHQKRILRAYGEFAEEPGFAAVVPLEGMAGQGFSLSIPLYVKRQSANAGVDEKKGTLAEAWTAWESSGRAFWIEMDAVVDMLDGLVEADRG